MGLFGRSSKTSGLDRGVADVTIEVKDDGFHLKATPRGDISSGDTLLVSYRTPRAGWVRQEIVYQEERKGMFVFTGEKPEEIVVLSLNNLQRSRDFREVKGSVWQAKNRRDRDDDSWNLSDSTNLFNGTNPLSPFHLFNPFNPLGIINIFSGMAGDQHHKDEHGELVFPKGDLPLVEHEGQHHHHGHTGTVDHAPGSNPFEAKNLDLESRTPGEGTREEGYDLDSDGENREEDTTSSHQGSEHETQQSESSSSVEAGAYS